MQCLQDSMEKYMEEHPLYYPTVPPLQTKCPVDYRWEECSSNEYGQVCRTCCNYNPLRMLCLAQTGSMIYVPMEVLFRERIEI